MSPHQGGPGRPMPGDSFGHACEATVSDADCSGGSFDHFMHSWGGDKSEDIFPSPLMVIPNFHCSHSSRPVRQRVARKLRAVEQTNRLITTLNNLFSGCFDSGQQSLPRSSAAQRGIVADLFARCFVDKPPSDVESPKAALSALLGAKATPYSNTEGLHGPAPYERDNVSLVEHGISYVSSNINLTSGLC